MGASLADFQGLTLTGVGTAPATDIPALGLCVKALAALFQAKVTVGSEPNDDLQGLYFGDGTNYRRFRIQYDTDGFFLHRNTGTQAAPVWVQVFKFDDDDGFATFAGGLSISGALSLAGLTLTANLDMGGQDITNTDAISCATINGISPAAHAARHNPGGADALALGGVPPSVAAASATGVAANFARGDHTHQGVHAIVVGLLGTLFGDVGIAQAGAIELSLPGGNTMQIASSADSEGETSADQAVVGTGETNVTSLTGLTLPYGGVFASVRRFRVDVLVQIVDTSGAAQDITVRFYNGVNGNLSDVTPKQTVVERVEASQDRTLSFFHQWTPADNSHTKFGISIQSSGGNYTVKGAGGIKSSITCIDVRV